MSPKKNYIEDLNLGFLLHDVSRRLSRAFDQHMEPIGLTRSQWQVLVYVARQPGIAQSQLADVLEIGRMAVTGLIDRMEMKGLLERRDDEADRRVKKIYLSAKTTKLLPKMEDAGEIVISQIMTGFNQKDRASLTGYLTDIKENILAIEKQVDTKRKKQQSLG